MAESGRPTGESLARLDQGLLQDPIPEGKRPDRHQGYPGRATVLVSLFIAFHLVAVLVHSAPPSPALGPLQAFLNRHAHTGDYLRAAGIARSWAVFAPDAPRHNVFIRVLVEGADGQEQDLGHEPFGRRQYPYFFYDRMGKINREMLRKKPYRLSYAGWVCREWERRHAGEPAREVRLVPIRTRVPAPAEAYKSMGYAPRGLEVEEAPAEVFPCASTQHGQLPARLRARYGLPTQGAAFRDVPRRSWAGRAGAEARDTEPAEAEAIE